MKQHIEQLFKKYIVNNKNIDEKLFYVNNLSKISLIEADLEAANFKKHNLREADLSRAFLYKADFGYANLRKATLQGTILKAVRVDRAKYNHQTIFPKDFDPINSGMMLQETKITI